MYIHESLSNHSDHATDRFTQAQLNLKYDHNGNMEASIEELPSGNVQYLYEDVVVDGISVVDLNTPTPPNVTANYVDSSGKVYSNVLSKDEDGNYILKIGDSENSTYRTATLVEVNNLEDHLISQDGDLLIKTVNGRYPALHKRLPEPTVENGDATN